MNPNHPKIILITGASSGIGKSTVKTLINNGHIVYGAARRTEKMADLKMLGAHILSMDVTEEDSMLRGVQQIIQEQSKIDVLINNAGYGAYGAVEDMNIEEAKRQFDVNLFGLARLTQLVLPYMRKNRSGTIVNISSMGGKIFTPMGAWYHATKFAVEAFSDCLRFETKQFGIDVVIVEPGSIKSEWNQIAVNSLLNTSGQSPYAELAQKVANLFQKGEKSGSPPEVIATTIAKAIQSPQPKTRYVAGKFARPFILMRKILPDRWYDKMLASQIR